MSGAFAWVTLLTQPDYLRGVETLQRSLRASGSPWPLVVMVTPAIDDQMHQHLQTRSCRVQEAPVIGPDPALALAANTIAACYACRCNPQRIAHYPALAAGKLLLQLV